VGLSAGLVSSIAGVSLAGPHQSESLVSTLFVELFSIIATAGYTGMVGAIFGGAGAFLTKRTRVIDWSVAILLGFWSLLHTLSVLVKVLAGVFPDATPVFMFVAAPFQFLEEGSLGLGKHALTLVLAPLLVMSLYFGTKQVIPKLGRPSLWLVCYFIVSLPFITSAFWLPRDSPFCRRLVYATAEQVFVASLSNTKIDLSKQSTSTITVQDGPSLDAASAWLSFVEKKKKMRTKPWPNVVIIMLESVSFDHLGFSGYRRDVSPNIDSLAERSVVYERAYTTSTQSNYAQMSILSSLVPIRRKRLDRYQTLNYPRVLWNDILGQLGYKTATISSQNESWQGMLKFQTSVSAKIVDSHKYLHSTDLKHLATGRTSEMKLPDHITMDHAIGWLKSTSKPFGLYVNLQKTHFPYAPNGAYRRRWLPDEARGVYNYMYYKPSEAKRVVNRYDNALAYVDEQIGRLIKYLSDAQVLDNTIVALVSDHGEMFGQGGMTTHGKSLHSQQIHVPMLLYSPQEAKTGRSEIPVSVLDLLPTILDYLDLPPHPAMQGHSLRDLDAYRQHHWAHPLRLQGLRFMDGLMCWPYLAVVDHSASLFRLFDLKRDPGQLFNLAHKPSALSNFMRQLVDSTVNKQMAYHNLQPAGFASGRFAPRALKCPSPENLRHMLNKDAARTQERHLPAQ
jgi:arylsulfatase A-like enzyme